MFKLRSQELEAMQEKIEHEEEAAALLMVTNSPQFSVSKFRKMKATLKVLGGLVDDLSDDESDIELDDDEVREQQENNFRLVRALRSMTSGCSLGNMSFLVTVYLGLAESWRNRFFNW